MSEQLLFWAGDRNPSLTETITSGGVAVDLTGATVVFKMRPVGGSSIALTGSTVVVSAAAGTVRFDWGTSDLATAGQYLVWWEVTVGGKRQDMAEALIEVRDHVAGTLPAYVELEQLKSSLTMTGFTFADQDLLRAARAASRAVDNFCGRRFYLDPDATGVRYYQPESASRVMLIDDLAAAPAAVAIDRDGDGTYEETWVNGTDYVLEPLNAPAKFWPYELLRLRWRAGRWFPFGVEKSIKVTGQFGWSAVPEDIQAVTSIVATKFARRLREAPFGIVTGGGDVGVAMRIVRFDPEVHPILSSYVRNTPYV